MAGERDDGSVVGHLGKQIPHFWHVIPIWLRIVAAILVGAAALMTAVPQFLGAAKGLFQPGYDRYLIVRTPDHYLALRDLPTKASDEILKMPENSVVECGAPSEDKPAWRKCKFGGHSGYASAYFLEKMEG